SLLDKSLLRQFQPEKGDLRFWMLQMIREFAQERLAESAEQVGIKRQHASYFLNLAEEAEPQLSKAQQAAWLDRLDLEHDNLRAVLGWAIESGEAQIGMRMAGALWRFWYMRSHLAEG